MSVNIAFGHPHKKRIQQYILWPSYFIIAENLLELLQGWPKVFFHDFIQLLASVMARATLQLACQYLSAISYVRVLQADQAQEHSFWLLSPPSDKRNHSQWHHSSVQPEKHSVSVLADHSSWSASPGRIALWLWHSGVEALGIQSPWVSFCFSGNLGKHLVSVFCCGFNNILQYGETLWSNTKVVSEDGRGRCLIWSDQTHRQRKFLNTSLVLRPFRDLKTNKRKFLKGL